MQQRPHATCSSHSMPLFSNHILPRCGLLLGLLAVVLSSAAAQQAPVYEVHPDYTVRQWTVREGLPANTVFGLVQSSDGYLWFGTSSGLVRFDGAQFTVYKVTNTPGLTSNYIGDVVEGPRGHLWIITREPGLTHYHEGRFSSLDLPYPLEGSHPFTILSHPLFIDGDSVWVMTKRGLLRYAEGQLAPYRQDLIDTPVRSVVRDNEGRLWVGTAQDGIYRIDPDGKTRRFTLEDGLPSAVVKNLIVDRDGSVWAGMRNGVAQIIGDRVEAWLGRSGIGYTMHYQDAAGGLWFASLEGGDYGGEELWRRDPSGAVTLHPLSQRYVMRHLPSRVGPDGKHWHMESVVVSSRGSYYSVFRDGEQIFGVPSQIEDVVFDRSGNLWVGTTRFGLFRLRPAPLRVLSEEEGLPQGNVYPVVEAQNGHILVGTYGGGVVGFDAELTSSLLSPPSMVLSLYEEADGTRWVGSEEPLCRMQQGQCKRVALPLPEDLIRGVRTMHIDRQGRFWIGGNGGLAVGLPDGERRSWSVLMPVPGLPSAWILSIVETRDGAVLFNIRGGGVLRYQENGAFEALTTDDGLPSNLVRDLYEDAEGFLWIAVADHGLCRLDRRGRVALIGAPLACIDTRDGLYSDALMRILEDDQGRLWFNTGDGIFWVERAMLNAYFAGERSAVASISYTEADGMRSQKGNGGVQSAGIKARDGRLWFPTSDGVVVIDPKAISYPEAPLVTIEEVAVDEVVHRASGLIVLMPQERDVVFHFAALELTHPEDVRYQYRLAGYDEDWQEGGTQRSATYTNLSPGSYSFHVRAGLGGVWGPEATIGIERRPYFWQTMWFYGLVGVFFVVSGPSIYVLRVRRLKAREAELEQTVAERTAELRRANELKSRFLANISHEFRTPLTLTFGPIDDLLQGRFGPIEPARPHFERARRNGHRLLRLINQLLDLSKLDAGALLLRPRRHDLAQHLRQITALFESMADTQGFHLATKIPQEPTPHVYDADKIEKVVINLLSNAFKFTPSGGKISVVFETEADGTAQIIVADTGPGIAEDHLAHLFDRFYQVEGSSTRAHEGTGIGLALVKELVELHQGTIAVESTVGFGTRFTVRLPILDFGLPILDSEAGPEAPGKSLAAQPLAEAALLDLVPVLPDDTSPFESEASEFEESKIQNLKSKIDDTVVLVVEDNADMRAYIRAHLEDHFTVVEAENGRLGLERALEVIPDLVLSDVMMPEMDGLEACAALKADERTSHIPVVLLTARAEIEHRIEGFESGADAYLPKPFNAEELRVRVRTLIEERRRLRARFAGEAVEPGVAEAAPSLPPREAAFLEKVQSVIEAHLGDGQFGVDRLAEEVLMSRSQLHRKLRALTGQTPASLLRGRRLEQASVLLVEGALSVKEVCYAVGFQSLPSFSRTFREAYGVTPSAYAEQARQRTG